MGSNKPTSPSTKPTRGVHVQSCMKWLLDILILNKPLTRPPIPVSDDPTTFNGGSFNMQLLFCVCWWVYEVLSGNKSGIARQRLFNYLKLDLLGHQNDEPTSPSHEQLYLGGWGAILLLAYRIQDTEVLNYAVDWFRVQHAIYEVCEIELTSEEKKKYKHVLSEVWTCGGRTWIGRGKSRRMVEGINPARGKFLMALRGYTIPGNPNQYDFGSWCMFKVANEGFDLDTLRVWPKTFSPMWTPFHARRYPNGYFYVVYDGEKWKDCALSAGYDGERWISTEIDLERIASYDSKFGSPTLSIDAPQSSVRAIEEGRKPKPKKKSS